MAATATASCSKCGKRCSCNYNGGKPLHPNTNKRVLMAKQVSQKFGIPYNDCLTCTMVSLQACLDQNDPSLLIVNKTGLPLIPPAVQAPPPPPVAPPPVKLTRLQALRAFYEALVEEVATSGYPAGTDPVAFGKAADKFDKALTLAERPQTPGEGVTALRAALKLIPSLIN